MIWLGSEFMFFSGLLAAFFTIRANAKVWPPPGTKIDTYQALIFTFVLLASSPTMQIGVWAEERGERAEHLGGGREDVALVIGAAEGTRPAVEELDRAGPCRNLREERRDREIR